MSSWICLGGDCAAGALEARELIGLAVALFHAIVFLQSGFDKVFDWKGNLEFMTGHFSNSPLAGPVAPLLAVVTVAEVGAGALSAAGAVGLLLGGQGVLAFWGALLAAISLLMVLFGQRMAKAYADAAVIAPYFLVACLGIWILGS